MARTGRAVCDAMMAGYGQCNCHVCVGERKQSAARPAANELPLIPAEETRPATKPPPAEDTRTFFGREGGVSKVEFYGWEIADSPGTFMMLPKAQLNVDTNYQRENVSNTRVLRISKEFSWIAFGVLIVAMRPDGTLWIIDGQHRKLAADKRDDINELPCMVFEAGAIAEEAGGFVRGNTVRGPVKAWHKYRALLLAKDKTCLEIEAMVERCGLHVEGHKSKSTVTFVSRLESQYRLNAATAEKMLVLCKRICDGESINGDMYAAICYYENFLLKNDLGSLASPENAKTLIAAGQTKIQQKMREAQNYRGKNGAKIAADGIAQIVNHKRRSKRLPSPIAGADDEDGDE